MLDVVRVGVAGLRYRVRWVSRNVSELAALGATGAGQVRGAIVTSLPLPPSLVARSSIPVVDVTGLDALLRG